MTQLRWTIHDLEVLPDEPGKRYEIIDGQLYVTTQPSNEHQLVWLAASMELQAWSRETGAGITIPAPGVIFAVDEAVAPDVVWVSRERRAATLGADGKLHGAPDLIIEYSPPAPRTNGGTETSNSSSTAASASGSTGSLAGSRGRSRSIGGRELCCSSRQHCWNQTQSSPRCCPVSLASLAASLPIYL